MKLSLVDGDCGQTGQGEARQTGRGWADWQTDRGREDRQWVGRLAEGG